MLLKLVLFLVIAQAHQFVNGGTTKKEFEDPSPIKYPGPINDQSIKEITNRYGVDDKDAPDIPDTCKGKRFCTVKPKNYPQEEFNKMFKGVKVMPQPTLVMQDEGDLNRQGDDSTDGCESMVTYEPIYQVLTDDGDWRMVVQAPDEDFVQRVRLEECVNTKKTCFTLFSDIPGVEKFCKQTYNSWEILVAAKKGRSKPEKVKTQLPVCCSCQHRMLDTGTYNWETSTSAPPTNTPIDLTRAPITDPTVASTGAPKTDVMAPNVTSTRALMTDPTMVPTNASISAPTIFLTAQRSVIMDRASSGLRHSSHLLPIVLVIVTLLIHRSHLRR